jgi:hypothetical protein
MLGTLGKTDAGQKRARVCVGGLATLAHDQLGNNDVLERAELGQELMELIDEADLFAPEPRAIGFGKRRAVAAVDDDAAAGRRLE